MSYQSGQGAALSAYRLHLLAPLCFRKVFLGQWGEVVYSRCPSLDGLSVRDTCNHYKS